MSDRTTCRVFFADGTPCTRTRAYGDGTCRQCKKWSYKNGDADPAGRQQRIAPTTPCAVTFADGTRCSRTALLKSKWCRICRNWSERSSGASPDGREQPSIGPGSGRATCTVVEDGEICGELARRHKMCAKHSERQKRHGDPLVTVKRSNGEILVAIEAAARATEDACILLVESGGGRPHAALDGVEMHASRAVWITANGDPGKHHVLHTCHRGAEGCINIRHLYLGDHDRNMLDMVEAGRSCRGERNVHAVLTAPEVQQIRTLMQEGVAQVVIAQRFGVSKGTVSAIKLGKVWGWLPPEEMQ